MKRFFLAAALAVLSVGVVATTASARFQPNSVVPVFCTSDTIPAGTELKLRIRWVVRNQGQIEKFLGIASPGHGQKLSWSVYDDSTSSPTLLAARNPSSYGDMTYWSAPVHSTTTDFNNDGVIDDVWYSDYLAPTGVTVALNQQVRVEHLLVADIKTDDGFFKGIPAGTPLSSSTPGATPGHPCAVTGA